MSIHELWGVDQPDEWENLLAELDKARTARRYEILWWTLVVLAGVLSWTLIVVVAWFAWLGISVAA